MGKVSRMTSRSTILYSARGSCVSREPFSALFIGNTRVNAHRRVFLLTCHTKLASLSAIIYYESRVYGYL